MSDLPDPVTIEEPPQETTGMPAPVVVTAPEPVLHPVAESIAQVREMELTALKDALEMVKGLAAELQTQLNTHQIERGNYELGMSELKAQLERIERQMEVTQGATPQAKPRRSGFFS